MTALYKLCSPATAKPYRQATIISVVCVVARIQRKRKTEVKKVQGIVVLRGPKRKSEKILGRTRPGRFAAFVNTRMFRDWVGERCRVVRA